MTSFFLMMVLVSAGVGVAAGALAVPWLADVAMKRAYRRSLSWWNESLQGAIAYLAMPAYGRSRPMREALVRWACGSMMSNRRRNAKC